ncbi:MAG: ATP-binding cassette domain-containing protein [Gemmatimonadaceae bacterium]|nr:ATP-binding cassette domain-containing protein [Gemmatimonadaceae bacterium]
MLDGVSVQVRAGECVVLFGPNGCGKTTLLDIAAGRTSADTGRVTRARDARVGYVFQRHADTLLPWRTVTGNVALPLEARGDAPAVVHTAVQAMLARVGLSDVASAYPYTLSGGQLQRVAIARALMLAPSLLLLDEPFTNVDYRSALQFAHQTRTLCRTDGVAVCCVTHDPDLAVLLADRVVVLSPRPGRVVATLEVPHGDTRTVLDIATPELARVRTALLDAVAHTVITA